MKKKKQTEVEKEVEEEVEEEDAEEIAIQNKSICVSK